MLLALNPKASQIRRSNLYFKLLDPALRFPSQELMKLTQKAEELDAELTSMETQITLAIAHLKNNSPAEALVALGRVSDCKWAKVRPAWRIIAANVFKQNGDTEKFLILSRGIKADELNRAERESLQLLFNFKLS